MSTSLKSTGQLLIEEDNPRWRLVERIVASPSFAKAERLSSFLSCVCELALAGQFESINEQHIGVAVFGRSPDYDPGVDSIVRSHASRLRHRLQQYFANEGAGEEILLSIPKGGYVPVFEPYRTLAASTETLPQLPAFLPDVVTPEPPASVLPEPMPESSTTVAAEKAGTAPPVATEH